MIVWILKGVSRVHISKGVSRSCNTYVFLIAFGGFLMKRFVVAHPNFKIGTIVLEQSLNLLP